MFLRRLYRETGTTAQEMRGYKSFSAPDIHGLMRLMVLVMTTTLALSVFAVPAYADNRTIDNTLLEETVNAEYEKRLKETQEASTIEEAATTAEGSETTDQSSTKSSDTTVKEAAVSTEGTDGEIDDAALNPADAIAIAESAVAEAIAQKSAGEKIVEFASQFIGNPYRYGGSSLTSGTDCSGFVMSVYRNFGISLPHSSSAMRSVGMPVGSLAEAQPGDIICYSGHVGIYLGDGKLLSALGRNYGITINSATYKRILAIRRLV